MTFVAIESTSELAEAVREHFGNSDCLIMAAAPSDFTHAQPSNKKIKRTSAALQLALTPTADILKSVASKHRPDQVVVGFALETDDAEANARKKLEEKHLDMIVVNNPRTPGAGFDHDTNQIAIIRPGQPIDEWPLMSKAEVAARLVERIAHALAERRQSTRSKSRG
jgi:phosphopantothenoylcysteine decarboxylase/phosphopantothenate--cysteine ligase